MALTLRWTYPSVPDLAGFRIRVANGEHRVWADGLPAHAGLLAGSSFVIPGANGLQTWMIKAVDLAGNESASAAYVVQNLGDPVPSHSVETVDFKALGFPGLITNGTVVATNLEADTSGLFWPALGTTAFWQGLDGDTYWSTSFLQMVYQASLAVPANRAGMDLLLDATVVGSPYTIEYGLGEAEVFWGVDANPFWNTDSLAAFWPAQVLDFLPWPGTLTNILEATYTLRVTTGAGPLQGVISGFTAIYDAPDIEESLSDVTILAAGTRLPITETYTAITTVTLTLQDDGGTGFTAKVLDKNPTLGPLIKVYDSTATAVNGLVDALIEGY